MTIVIKKDGALGALRNTFDGTKIKTQRKDTRSIDIDDAYTLDFWARELNVSKAKLTAAVLAAGSAVADVKGALKIKL